MLIKNKNITIGFLIVVIGIFVFAEPPNIINNWYINNYYDEKEDMTKIGDFQVDSSGSRDYWGTENFFQLAKFGSYWYVTDENASNCKIWRTDNWTSWTNVYTATYIKSTYGLGGILKVRDGWLYFGFAEDTGSINRLHVIKSDTGGSGDWDDVDIGTDDYEMVPYDIIWVDDITNSWTNTGFLVSYGMVGDGNWEASPLIPYIVPILDLDANAAGLGYGTGGAHGTPPMVSTGYSYINNNGHEVYVYKITPSNQPAEGTGIHSWCGTTSADPYNDDIDEDDAETPEIIYHPLPVSTTGSPGTEILFGPLCIAPDRAYIRSGNVWGIIDGFGSYSNQKPCPIWDYDSVTKLYFPKYFVYQTSATNVNIYKFAGGLYKIQELTITSAYLTGQSGWNDRFDVGDRDGDHDRSSYILSSSTFSTPVNLIVDSQIGKPRSGKYEYETTSLDDTLSYMFYTDDDDPLIFGTIKKFDELKHTSPYYYKIDLIAPTKRELEIRVGISFEAKTVDQIIRHVLSQKCLFLYAYDINTPDSTTYTIDFTGSTIQDLFDWVTKITGYVLYWEPFGGVHLDDGTTDHSPAIAVGDDDMTITKVVRAGKKVSAVHLYGGPHGGEQTSYEVLSLRNHIDSLIPTEYIQQYPSVDSDNELQKLADVILATRDSNVKRITGKVQGKGPLIPGMIIEITSTELGISAVDYIVMTSKYFNDGGYCIVTFDSIIYHSSLESNIISSNLNFQAINKSIKIITQGGEGSVEQHSDVTDAGSGIIISDVERTRLHDEQHNNDQHDFAYHLESDGTGVVTVHSDMTSAGSGSIITTGERSNLHALPALSGLTDIDVGLSAVIKSMETVGTGSYPTSPNEGQIYWDADECMLLRWNVVAQAWIEIGGGAGLVGGNSLYLTLSDASTLYQRKIGDEITQSWMVGANGFVDSTYYGASKSVPMLDISADLYMGFYIPIGGTYTLKLIHAKDDSGGATTVVFHSYIGEVTASESFTWNIRNNFADGVNPVTWGIIYISDVETGITLADHSVLFFRIHKDENESAGNWHIYGGILEKTA